VQAEGGAIDIHMSRAALPLSSVVKLRRSQGLVLDSATAFRGFVQGTRPNGDIRLPHAALAP
jgi:hypothetical protein